jgi:hypothetical protein
MKDRSLPGSRGESDGVQVPVRLIIDFRSPWIGELDVNQG